MQHSAQSFSFLSPERAVRAARIHEGMQVADFHSASGFFTRAAARAVGPGGRVWAVDADRGRLVRLKNTCEMEGLENIEIVRGNIERRCGTLLPEGGIDMVILVGALFAAENKDDVVEEVWRVIKKSGRVLVVDWKDSFGGLGPQQSQVILRDEALRLFIRGGFSLVEDIPAGDYHWGLLLRKK